MQKENKTIAVFLRNREFSPLKEPKTAEMGYESSDHRTQL